MGECVQNDVMLLFDSYGQESRNLYESFCLAGCRLLAAAIEDDGFLPEEITSVYGYFLGDFGKNPALPQKPRYFNQITLPEYWEITATNVSGKIFDEDKERGRIFYADPANKRLVKEVDWLDESGIVRASDHYNRFGALYAKMVYNAKGQKFSKTYFTADGKEKIVENFVTGDIILNEDGKVFFFSTKTDFVLHFLKVCGYPHRRLFFNSLSTPFFVSQRLEENGHGDILFWNEPERPDIPGNMQIILDGSSSRTGHIFVQKKKSYEKMITLGALANMISAKGYVYPFEQTNPGGSDALICTNSDSLLKVKELVLALPQVHFHIAAITEMSAKLMSMGSYPNVSLYPVVKKKMYEALLKKCSIYLDINYQNEILSSLRRAFLNDQLIFAFRETMHEKDYTADDHIFTADHTEDMIAAIAEVLRDEQAFSAALLKQHEAALSESADAYRALQ